MKKLQNQYILVIIISFLPILCFKTLAQNFDNYINIKSSGEIPADFLGLSSSKFKADKTTISKEEETYLKRSKKKFYLENNFLVDELLHNGKVLYNDPIGIYVNKVLDKVLVHKPELKKQIRVYVVLSDIVNAYATNNGIIFINIGLLAKLENEAQLAFILGHEVTHFEKNHVLNRFVLNEKIQRKKIRINYSDSNVESILFSNTTYAKDQEIESDIESTKLLLGTLYNPKAGMEVMKILASDIPLKDTYHFTPSFFSKETSLHITFKSIDFDSLKYTEDLEADSKTHPALSQRITTISKLFDSLNHNKSYFILPQKDFFTIQKIAQFEVSKIFLKKGNYLYAFYCIYELLQNDPNNAYLNNLLCKTFYLASKYRNSQDQDNLNTTTSNTPKEIQFIAEYLKQLSDTELNILSTYFYLKTYPGEETIVKEIRLRDLLYDFKFIYQDNEENLEHIPNGRTTIASIPFVEKYLNSISEESKNSFTVDNDGLVLANKKKSKTGYAKIDNIIILDPVYKKFDLRRKTEEKFIASEKSLLIYNEQIRKISNQLKIRDTIVSSVGWTKNDTLAFHNHSLFKSQVEEVLTNGSQIISTDFELVDTTCNGYKSHHLALMGTYSFHIQKSPVVKVFVVIWTALVFPTFPIGLYYAVTPSFKTYTYLITLNCRNQAFDYKNVRLLKYRDSMGAINSSMYYQLLKMKKGK
ncbi:M48 family metallopeptidase [uncultured Cytophaga sp.]|uniref:M48 family metallopeptidase n=1 Tax=uncultured Cytophaga sp. TaxID=160238 RepID=UPI00260AA0A1|nr:M48 family metallopeptidase [uncultured Cytophaga sp.]